MEPIGRRRLRTVRIGVIGLGFGRCHAKILARMSGVRLVAVAEATPLVQRLDLHEFATRLGARAYRDGRRLLEREKVDAIVIAVPPGQRDPLLGLALDFQIAVFLEKPLAVDVASGAAWVARFEDVGAPPVMIDFCLRHLPAVVRLRELLSGQLGDPLLASGDLLLPRYDSPTWVWDSTRGNGIINENTCHLFDLMAALFGDPASAYASGGSYLGAPMEDGVAVALRFVNGTAATLTGGALGAAALATPARLSLYTANGQAVLSGRDHAFSRLEWATATDKTAHLEEWPPPNREEIASPAMEHFVTSLREGTRPVPGLKAGLVAVALSSAVRRSLASGLAVPLAEILPPNR